MHLLGGGSCRLLLGTAREASKRTVLWAWKRLGLGAPTAAPEPWAPAIPTPRACAQRLGCTAGVPYPLLCLPVSCPCHLAHALMRRHMLASPRCLAPATPQELLGTVPYPSLWLRYSGFIVLYPVGVASELTMAYLALPTIKATRLWNYPMPNKLNFAFDYYVVCLLIIASYLPGLPQLYGYMLTQRKKQLGGAGATGKKGPKQA